MARKKIGGCLFRKDDIIEVLKDQKLDGIAFKIDKAINHTSVDLDIYGATYGANGLKLNNSPFPCSKKACRVTHRDETNNLSAYTFEHMGEFSKFDADEPLIAYFTRGQVDMILALKDFEYILLCSYIPRYCDVYENIEFHEPNFSLTIQPYQFKHEELLLRRDNLNGEPDNGSRTTIVFAAACPKRWVPD